MNEDILPCGPLDKPVSLSPVKPFYCALLSHKKLLSPLLCLNSTSPAKRTLPHHPLKACGQNSRGCAHLPNPRTTRKAPEFSAVGREHGAKLWSLSWWREFRRRYTQHQPELTNTVALKCGNEHRIIAGSCFLARGEFQLVKRFRM